MKKYGLIVFALFLVAGGLLAAGHTLSQGPRMMGGHGATLDGTCTGSGGSGACDGCNGACDGSCTCSGDCSGLCAGCGGDGSGGDGQGNGGSGCGGNGGGCSGHLTSGDFLVHLILDALRLS